MTTAIEIYMANRIISEALDYTTVVTKRPDLKIGINEYLTSQSKQNLIVV